MAIPQIPSSRTDLLGFHGQLELGLWEKICSQPSCLFLSLQAWHNNRPHSAIVPTSSASLGLSPESQQWQHSRWTSRVETPWVQNKDLVPYWSYCFSCFLFFSSWHKSSVWHKMRIELKPFVLSSRTNFTLSNKPQAAPHVALQCQAEILASIQEDYRCMLRIPSLLALPTQLITLGTALLTPELRAQHELTHLCVALASGCNFCHSGIAALIKEKKNKKTLFKDLHFTLGHKQYIHNQCSNLSPVSCWQKLCGKLIFKCNFSSPSI